jgi:hypothetical protein
MTTREEAKTSARKVLALLEERAAEYPGYGAHSHAHAQLLRMLVELGSPCLPPASGREWVDIGLMAVKELESADPDLANALMDADYDFKHAD